MRGPLGEWREAQDAEKVPPIDMRCPVRRRAYYVLEDEDEGELELT